MKTKELNAFGEDIYRHLEDNTRFQMVQISSCEARNSA